MMFRLFYIILAVAFVGLWFSAWEDRSGEVMLSSDYIAAQFLKKDGYEKTFIASNSLAADLAFKREILLDSQVQNRSRKITERFTALVKEYMPFQNRNRNIADELTELIREFIPRLNQDGFLNLSSDEKNRVIEVLAKYPPVPVPDYPSLIDIFGYETAKDLLETYPDRPYRVRPKWYQAALYADIAALTMFAPFFVWTFHRQNRSRNTAEEKIKIERTINKKPEPDEMKKARDTQFVKTEMLSELRLLFLESTQFHRIPENAPLKDALEHCRCQFAVLPKDTDLTKDENIKNILEIIAELRRWRDDYYRQNDVRHPFFRPDSWSRFECQFPNHFITKELTYFTK